MRRTRIPGLALVALAAALLVSACTSPTGPEVVVSQDVKIDVQNDREWSINIFASRDLLPVWEQSVAAGNDTIFDFPIQTALEGPVRFVVFPQDPRPVANVWSDTLELMAGDVVEIVAAANIGESSIEVRSR